LPPNRQQETIRDLAGEYADCYTMGKESIESVCSFASQDISTTDIACSSSPELQEDTLCAIVFTSGSTGKPSPSFKTWRTLRDGSHINAGILLDDRCKTGSLIATVPPQHMWGFETSVLLPLCADFAVSDQTPFFPQDIRDQLAALPAPRMLVSSPVHLDSLLKSGVDDIHIDRIFCATALLTADVARSLEERFGATVVEAFGCSESGIIATRATARESLWNLAPGFDLQVEKTGTTIRASHLTEVVALNDNIRLVGESQFEWLGRHEDMVNIAGKRGSLADLNRRLLAIDGIDDGVLFLPDNAKRLAALVVAPHLSSSAILDQLRAGIDAAFLPRPVIQVDMLPRQATGKLPRKNIVALFDKMRGRPDS
jgi:acyl-coenzyme A synthetase/AMP-(fatty) acid ligase